MLGVARAMAGWPMQPMSLPSWLSDWMNNMFGRWAPALLTLGFSNVPLQLVNS
jgi:hypothetical protein